MTKHEFFEKLINKKDTWHVQMPIFIEQNEIIEITKGICYRGALQINMMDRNVLFECFIEPLKGIIKPMNPYMSMKAPVIEYTINPEGLKENYVYEDRLTCYYLGGMTIIDFKFVVIDEMLIESKDEKLSQPTKKISLKNKEDVKIKLSKLTFGREETIQLNIINQSKKPRHLTFKCKQDFITPNFTEVFLNDQWSQEWYLKRTMVERLFGNLSFRNEPFKDIIIEGFIDHELKASYVIKAGVTIYDVYETHRFITDDHMYNKTKLTVFRHYIEGLVNASSRREASNLLDLIKACLNYNQQDLELRLFHIWLLLEFGHKKEAKLEMTLIEKYEDYYSASKEYPLILILKGIANKDISNINEVFDDIDESSTWLELLAKARYSTSRNNRYNYYKTLYAKGVRRSFLFAEVTSLLNQRPIIPEEDDDLYVTTLKWAFNKTGVSSSWLNKLERHYYQLEKNAFMTSSLAKELYKLKKSKNFLRLFCQLCINEKRYDHMAYEGFKEALESKIYIQDLESHYIYASWQEKEELTLDLIKYFTKIRHLDNPIREYLYLSVIKKKSTYAVLYRRLYQEIMTYLKETTNYSVELVQIVSYMFKEFSEEKNVILCDIMTYSFLNIMKAEDIGKNLLGKIFDFLMMENCWMDKNVKEQMEDRIIDIVGFEGLSSIYKDKEKAIKYFKNMNNGHSYSAWFLDNDLFKADRQSEDLLTEIYIKIIVDDFMDNLLDHYFKLNEEDSLAIKPLLFYHVGRRIVLEYEDVSEDFLEEMYKYYIGLDNKPVWLLIAMIQALKTNNEDLIKRIRNLYEEGQKHDIIVPWFSEGVFDEQAEVIHYLSHPNDDVIIYYRFNEDKEFMSANMKHLAYGVFIHRIKLFYGENFEYYIVIKDSMGVMYLPHSDLIINESIAQNSLLLENEYSVEVRLDNITLSYELNDELSAKVFIEEQLDFNQRIKKLLKV